MATTSRGLKRVPKLAEESLGAAVAHQLNREGHAGATPMRAVRQSARQRDGRVAAVVERDGKSSMWPG